MRRSPVVAIIATDPESPSHLIVGALRAIAAEPLQADDDAAYSKAVQDAVANAGVDLEMAHGAHCTDCGAALPLRHQCKYC